MELKDVLLKRRSVRKFKEDKISDEIVNELLHAAMSGPSAVNRCPWEFFVISNEDTLKQMKDVSKFTKIDAPLAIVVCGNKSRFLPLGLSDFWLQDCSAASENILLRACDLNLGSVWCGVYPQKGAQKKLSEILDLKSKYIPLNIIYIGYPLNETEPRDQFDEKKIHFVK